MAIKRSEAEGMKWGNVVTGRRLAARIDEVADHGDGHDQTAHQEGQPRAASIGALGHD